MIFGLISLVLLLTAWVATLWLLIAPDFGQWPLLQLVAVHLGPPLLLWGCWMTWRRIRRSKAERAAAEREKLAEKEKQEKAEAARQKYEAELSRLRYGCDCRALAMAQVSVVGDDKSLVQEAPGIGWSKFGDLAADEGAGGGDSEQALLGHLLPAIKEALTSIYQACPAAVAFPLYLSPPAECSGKEVVASLRQMRADLAKELGLPFRVESEFNRALFLPSAESVAGSIIGLFEAHPELPAAVILAFDSPLRRARGQAADEAEWQGERQDKYCQLHGQPGQGAVALFVTHPQLREMLRAAPASAGQYDAMTPYWEKAPVATGSAARFEPLSADDRERLQATPVLARIHRAVSCPLGGKAPRSMELARMIEGLLKQARVRAALVDPEPGMLEEDAGGVQEPASGAPELPPAECRWLVHNAGGVGHAGLRLSALGVALSGQSIELDLIEEATNVPGKAGDLGQARGAAMLALTVARAASAAVAALCVEYTGDADNAGITLSFAVAPRGDAFTSRSAQA